MTDPRDVFSRKTCKRITCTKPTAFGSEYCLNHTKDVTLAGGSDD